MRHAVWRKQVSEAYYFRACRKWQWGKAPLHPLLQALAKASRTGGLRVPLNPQRDIYRKMMFSRCREYWEHVCGPEFDCW